MMKKKTNRVVVAEGEATGHAHVIEGVDVKIDGDNLSVPDGGKITHEEHNAFRLPAGNYVRKIVKEYDHFAEEAREVVD